MLRPGYLGDLSDFAMLKEELRNGELRRVVVSPKDALKYADLVAAGVYKEVPYGYKYKKMPTRDVEVSYVPEYMRYSKIFPNLPIINRQPFARLRDTRTFNTLLI